MLIRVTNRPLTSAGKSDVSYFRVNTEQGVIWGREYQIVKSVVEVDKDGNDLKEYGVDPDMPVQYLRGFVQSLFPLSQVEVGVEVVNRNLN
jgi:hypothetical protein